VDFYITLRIVAGFPFGVGVDYGYAATGRLAAILLIRISKGIDSNSNGARPNGNSGTDPPHAEPSQV
jgi:hypothetical protein